MPIASDTIICNLALSAIGTRSTITSLTEASAEAQTCALHYVNVRNELLRDANWNFARKQINLALLNDSTQLSPAVTTTITFANGATTLNVSVGTQIVNGSAVTGTGIAPSTTVTNVVGGLVTLSAATTSSQTAVSITFTPTSYQPVPQPWVYEYAYPNDCLKAREILPLIPSQQINQQIFGTPNNGTVNGNGWGTMNRQPVIRFLISNDLIGTQNQTVVLTNQPNAILVYTYEVTDPSKYDPDFVYALAGRLASRISIALSGDKQLTTLALKTAEDIVTKAKARDGNEGIADTNREAEWIRARGFRWSYMYPDGPWGNDSVTTGCWGGSY